MDRRNNLLSKRTAHYSATVIGIARLQHENGIVLEKTMMLQLVYLRFHNRRYAENIMCPKMFFFRQRPLSFLLVFPQWFFKVVIRHIFYILFKVRQFYAFRINRINGSIEDQVGRNCRNSFSSHRKGHWESNIVIGRMTEKRQRYSCFSKRRRKINAECYGITF